MPGNDQIPLVAGLTLPSALFLHQRPEFKPRRRCIVDRTHKRVVLVRVQDEEPLIEKNVGRESR